MNHLHMSLPFISKCKIVKQKGFSFDEIVQSWTKETASVLFCFILHHSGAVQQSPKCIFSKHLLYTCYLLNPLCLSTENIKMSRTQFLLSHEISV